MATLGLLVCNVQAAGKQEKDTLQLWVNGLCGMCEQRIEKAALKTRGVESASWDADSKTLVIAYHGERFKTDRLHYAIASVGYDTRLYSAPDPVYAALPGCCKYRDFDSHDKAKMAAAGISDREGELDLELEEVTVAHRRKSTAASFSSTAKAVQISEDELCRAACCNLSESFETNPSVDASFTDAVSGTRRIEMLGLAGPYVQITRENMPEVRMLSAQSGLSFTPGTWIEGMMLNMGSGSVVNGFEAITGQINLELRKPESSDRLFLHSYGDTRGRTEANIMGSYSAGEQLDGSLMLHGMLEPLQSDHNGDGFMDHPSGSTLIAQKRFKFTSEKGFESQLGIKALGSDLHGGQLSPGSWESRNSIRRLEAWAKAGKVFRGRPYSSIGFQLSGVLHGQEASFGLRNYEAQQHSLYANLIYQSILGSTNHQYRTGLSFQYDRTDENLELNNYQRNEQVPGAFVEYTYNHLDRFTLVAGLRADIHNKYGAFLTPRLHLRYEPVQRSVFRASVGRGQKTASIFAENTGILASSRAINLLSINSTNPYGLEPETAWTMGLNFQQGFRLGSRDGVFLLDYFHTRFTRQVVVDLENPGSVGFYMLEGESRGHSIQVQADQEVLEGVDLSLAYRFNDPRTTYGDRLLLRPFTSQHRAMLSLAYTSNKEWIFDLSWNWQGRKRLPSTASNPLPYRLEEYAPAFSLLNLQVGKRFERGFEIYTGVENLLGFTQDNPILAADDPFGSRFDASMIWGPIVGRRIYINLRFRLP